MTPESRKLYKLIILYFLSLTKQPMSNAIISDFILTNNYTDYFSIQETLTNLLEDDMIESEQTHATSYYKIKPAGQEILTFFGKQLPDSTKAQIRKYLSENRVSIVENTSIHTDYTHVKNKEYIARCSIVERGSVLLEVSLNVPTEEEAIQVCKNFKKKNEKIYSLLFSELSVEYSAGFSISYHLSQLIFHCFISINYSFNFCNAFFSCKRNLL